MPGNVLLRTTVKCRALFPPYSREKRHWFVLRDLVFCLWSIPYDRTEDALLKKRLDRNTNAENWRECERKKEWKEWMDLILQASEKKEQYHPAAKQLTKSRKWESVSEMSRKFEEWKSGKEVSQTSAHAYAQSKRKQRFWWFSCLLFSFLFMIVSMLLQHHKRREK